VVANSCTMRPLAIDTGGVRNMRRGYAVANNGIFMGAIAVALLMVLMGIVAGAALAQDDGSDGSSALRAK
jgi:hypothetical protein